MPSPSHTHRPPLRFRGLLPSFVLLATLAACSPKPTAPGAAAPSTGVASAEPATATSATATSATATSAKGASVFVVHEVSNFQEFQRFFDEGSADRSGVGVKGYLLTKLDDGRVVIHLFADDLDKVQAALNSPRLQEYLGRRGAPDASLVWVTRNTVLSVPETPPTVPTFSLYLKLHVADFEAFRSAFEAKKGLFAADGVIGLGLHQSTAKEDIAILHFMGTARDKLEALPARPAFVELLALAKPDGKGKPLIGSDVARNRPK